jgi:predicted dehydrogenase
MASGRRQMTYRVVGSHGEALVTNFVGPHLDDRLIIRTRSGEHEERQGARSSYTYQLEAFTCAVRGEASLPIDVDDAVTNMRLIDACIRGRRTARPAADAEDSRIHRQQIASLARPALDHS